MSSLICCPNNISVRRLGGRFLPYILAAFIIFAHVGVNEYLSFMFVGFLCLGLRTLYFGFDRRVLIFTLFLFSLQAIALFSGDRVNDGHLMLSLARESIVIFILLNIIASFPKSLNKNHDVRRLIYKTALVVLASNVVLVVLQLVDSLTFNFGYADLPQSFYALHYGTLLSQIRDSYSSYGLFLRPSALYSEPSALGMVGVIFSIISMKLKEKKLMAMSFFLVISSMSMSAYIALVGILLVNNIRYFKAYHFMLFICVIPVLYFFMSERIHRVVQGTDGSALIRLTVGFDIMKAHYESGKYFGVRESEANYIGYLLSGRESVLDNYVFYKVIIFGSLSLLFFLFLFLFLGVEVFVCLFLFGFVNGSLFYYDRLLFLSVLFAVLSFSWKGGLLMRRGAYE